MQFQTRRIIVRFAEAEDRAAIRRFNSRLEAGGRPEQLRLDPRLPGEARHGPGRPSVYRRLMIAEDGQEMRAGMMLLHGTIVIRGEERAFCWTQMPLSEGLVDRAHSLAIVQLVRSALAYQPLMMALGVGGGWLPGRSDLVALLIRLGWKHATVPFLFYPVRATKVLTGLNYLRTARCCAAGRPWWPRPALGQPSAVSSPSGAGLLLASR